MTAPDGAGDGSHQAAGDDAACWQEAARLRQAHPTWVIIWLAPAAEYRAYRRLPGARRDTTLAAGTPEGLAAAISQAQQSVPQASRGRRRP